MKIRPDATREDREKWIAAKYQWRGFVSTSTRSPRDLGADQHVQQCSQQLWEAAAAGDVEAVHKALACGGDAHWVPPGQSRSAVEAACEGGHELCVELLLINGAAAPSPVPAGPGEGVGAARS